MNLSSCFSTPISGRIQFNGSNMPSNTLISDDSMRLHYGDLTDSSCLVKIINQVQPSEIYNLGAQSHMLRWEGSGVNEVGKEKDTGTIRVKVNPKYFRPSEVDLLVGDSTKARKQINWKPNIGFEELVREMVEFDINLMKKNPAA